MPFEDGKPDLIASPPSDATIEQDAVTDHQEPYGAGQGHRARHLYSRPISRQVAHHAVSAEGATLGNELSGQQGSLAGARPLF
jgi:hypothetical protein